MATAIKTNIQEHFHKRQCKYISIRYQLKKKEALQKQKEINQEANKTKQSKEKCLPNNIIKSVNEDLVKYPERFLYPMWKMNQYFIKHEKRRKHLLCYLYLMDLFLLLLFI